MTCMLRLAWVGLAAHLWPLQTSPPCQGLGCSTVQYSPAVQQLLVPDV